VEGESQPSQGIHFNTSITVRYEPQQSETFWGRAEYSAAFELIPAYIDEGHSFSRALRLNTSFVVRSGEKLDWVVAPEATVYTGGLWGKRLGAAAVARIHADKDHLDGILSWSGATHSSSSNPASELGVGFSYRRDLSGWPWLQKLSPHISAELLKATGHPNAVFAYEGVEYEVTSWLSLDLYAQHWAAPGSAPDHRIAIGTSLNLSHRH
jgi:hypothetical protein